MKCGILFIAAALLGGCASQSKAPPSDVAQSKFSNCSNMPPPYEPVQKTHEGSCPAGSVIVNEQKGKSPVVRFNFLRPQQVTIKTVSGATSSGGNGIGTQVCIWQSWDSARPCGTSPISQDGYNAWDGEADCNVIVPAGTHYVRALHKNTNADELNTTLKVTCR